MGSTPVGVDAAAYLAGLNPVEVSEAVFWRKLRLPRVPDHPKWEQPHLASLRPAWEQVRAQSVVNGLPVGAVETLDLSDGPLMEWLYQNLFATLLQFASLCLRVDGVLHYWVTVGQVGNYLYRGGSMKTLMLDSVGKLSKNRVSPDNLDLDVMAEPIAALVRSCWAHNPETDVGTLFTLIPYLVGLTPRDRWMHVDRALAYREAGVTSGEARAWEFGLAKDRPSSEALRTLTALNT